MNYRALINSNFHLIQSKILPMNDFELTAPDLYFKLNEISAYLDIFGFFIVPAAILRQYDTVNCRLLVSKALHIHPVGKL